MTFVDQTLTCKDCSGAFVFSAGEQSFYQAKGLQNVPGRCPDCRVSYKQARGIYEERAPKEYFVAVCAECGQEAKVPFFPRNDRPVYCSPCFDQVKQTLTEIAVVNELQPEAIAPSAAT